MGGKSKSVTTGFWYKMGLHFIICHAADALRGIYAGGRQAWSGYESANTQIDIDAEQLFGGKKREGGILGAADLMFGRSGQTANDYLASKIAIPLPPFRGFFGLVFRGGKVTANNPYIKPWEFDVERFEQGWANETDACWYPEKVRVTLVEGVEADEVVIVDLHDEFEYQFTANTVPADPLAPSIPSSGYFTANGGFGHDGNNSPQIPYTEWAPNTGIWVRKTITTTSYGRLRVYGGVEQSAFIYVDGVFLLSANPTNANVTPPTFSDTVLLEPGAHTIACLALDEAFDFGGSDNTNLDLRAAFTAISGFFEEMNPAHMLYQSLTDTEFGMGQPSAMIDEATYTAAADTLFDEGFGLFLQLVQQQTVEEFMQEVLNHCGGVQYTDPTTGKWVFKLIRDDYDAGTLEVFDEEQIVSIESFQRPGYGETVNQIIVKYRDQLNEGKEAATPPHNDLANIQAQGATVSQTRNYVGLPTFELASRVALRDLRAASTPLAKFRVTMTRAAWALRPGDVIKLSWAKLGLSEVIVRVLGINTGTLVDGTIVLDCAEDVFGLPDSSYVGQEDSGFVLPDTTPQPIVLQDVLEAPYWDVSRTLGPADLALVDADAAYIETVAAPVNGLQLNYQIYSRISPAEYDDQDLGEYIPTATVSAAVAREDTLINYADGLNVDQVDLPARAMIGAGRLAEFVEVTAIDEDSFVLTVNRAVLDTTPQEHAIGARIWFIGEEISQDSTERATADDVDVKLIAISGSGDSLLADATEMSIVPDQRFYRPYPPGNVLINGDGYPTAIVEALSVTYADRDRIQQTAGYIPQTDGDIGPEAGTTYNGYLYDDDTDTLLDSDIGITSPWTPALVGVYRLRLEIESERDGVASWQRQVRVVDYVVDGRLTEHGEARATEDNQLRAQE